MKIRPNLPVYGQTEKRREQDMQATQDKLEQYIKSHVEMFQDLERRSSSDNDEERDKATTEAYESTYGVAKFTVYEITLYGGGPGGHLEVFVDGDHEIDRIVFHHLEWDSHDQRELKSDEFKAAEWFAYAVLPEL